MFGEKGYNPGLPIRTPYFSSRLLKKLEGVLTAPVTAVEAPAGYGKTTALKHFLGESLLKTCLLPIYWWAADEINDQIDCRASWLRLCAQLSRIDAGAGGLLSSIGFPGPSTARQVGQVISGMGPHRPCILVLDDFQFMQQKLPRIVMAALLSSNGTNLHIIIVTQTVRPYQRAFFEQHGVYYIGTNDLKLQISDIRHYFRICGKAISRSDAEELYSYTEGWIVALYLIMLQTRRGEGFAPGPEIIRLMDSIVWENIPKCQKSMILYSAIFTHVSAKQMLFFIKDGDSPVDVLEIIEGIPFIEYQADKGSA